MSVSRDDFSIAFRSALLQESTEIFSSFFNISCFNNILDIYGNQFTKPVKDL